MVQTASTMMPLGTPAPDFSLPDTQKQTVSLKNYADAPGLLVMFLSNHCPYVKLVREEIARIGREYGAKGVGIVAVMANDVQAYPDDAPDKMALEVKDAGYTFPYLYDETQEVAKAYGAACTPDFFLFDAQKRLVYRGQMDDARPGNNRPVTGADLRAALDALLAGKPVSDVQRPSLGCNIKWKPGNAPAYFSS
ncbi:MAG TPA: thioredoxin family protein [Candidatus Hydrogenedentes bacterium]|jgi:peroxiredoxin|nr:MAG: thiol-disulfide oxidoreductase [Candidatus Hydrogenedentes bacterium ADurb.Bin170]HNZ48800.1 thioredoxin family protein [Candidatus Hydrogenedentota bacterium]HOH43739.1 thioredoxin family protein [Candidatus Hydrogenedentota bacterium]HOR51426.1 thioredoxin family protein [Candidatus Hydrogenedentota bacterium]HPX86116.1 thioredoxin family protein [Candidatus Hydrogenedentota bacterium]